MSSRSLLIISPWADPWSLGSQAGVADDVHFVRGFQRAGWRIQFLSPEGATDEDLDRVERYTYRNFFEETEHYPVALKRLTWTRRFEKIVTPLAESLVESTNPDMVLGHSHYTAPVTHHLRKRFGIPTVVKLFGVMDLVHTHWPAWKYRFKNHEQLRALRFEQDGWIVLDDGTRGDEILVERGIPEDRVHFLPNGIDVQWGNLAVNRRETRAEWEIPDDAIAVLFLARLVKSKRPEDFIRAAAEAARNTGRKLAFVVAGDGDLRDACEKLADDLSLGDQITFLGAVPHDSVAELMHSCDMFVTCSSLSNMAIPTCEALVCALPVVTYNVGDTGKVVVDGETGRLVADGDTVALGQAIAALADDDDRRNLLGENASQFAQHTFTGWAERIQMEIDLFDSLLDP